MPPPPPATALFFILALGLTWLLQLPAVLATRGLIPGAPDAWMGLAMLGTFGPLFSALVTTRVFERGKIRDLLRDLLIWRVHPGWYVVALFLPGVIYAVGAGLYLALGGEGVRWLYPPADAQRIAAFFVVPFIEEIAWRGFAQPRLVVMHGPVKGTAILGVLWFAWHIPMFLLVGVTSTGFALALPFFVAASFVFTWLGRHTRNNLLLAVLLHMGAHLNNSHQALPGNVTPLAIHTAAFCVVVAALFVFDRKAWRAD